MKILLVAEGVRELGDLATGAGATGAVWIRRLLAAEPDHELEVVPFVLPRLRQLEKGPRGEDENAARAVREARRQGCDGLVFLRDADGDPEDRRRKNAAGLAMERAAGPPAVLGIQIQVMETWLLADVDSFERVLKVRPALPKPPEQLWGRPRTLSHPKEVYNRAVLQATGRNQRDTAIRLAEEANLDVLARECPEGFGRFRADFERAFPMFDCVVAADRADGIGTDNDLPWPALKTDLDHVRDLTSKAAPGKRNAIIMGRKTWESVPANQRPLRNRLNVVISRGTVELAGDAIPARSLDDALTQASQAEDVDKLFVIGGAEIFRQAFAHVRCRDVVLTRIDYEFNDVDAHIPSVMERFELIEPGTMVEESGFEFRIERWRRRPLVTIRRRP